VAIHANDYRLRRKRQVPDVHALTDRLQQIEEQQDVTTSEIQASVGVGLWVLEQQQDGRLTARWGPSGTLFTLATPDTPVPPVVPRSGVAGGGSSADVMAQVDGLPSALDPLFSGP
jgi:hypothetical protein